MPLLAPGRTAPDFRLKDTTLAERGLDDFRRPGGTLLVFLKTECPTCRLALPFVDRLHRAYAGDQVSVVAVAENTVGEAKAFLADLGLVLPLLAEPAPYPVSSSYGLSSTPTFFLLDGDGVIDRAQTGFLKEFFTGLSGEWAAATGRPPADPFEGEPVPPFSPG